MSVRALATRSLWLFVCGFLPLVALFYSLRPIAGAARAVDFHYAYYPAGEAILRGEDFYPVNGFVLRGPEEFVIDYVYPPLIAIATIPWTLLPVGLAEVIFQMTLVVAFVATLALLGVRDWRCYGLAFLWPPVTDAIGTANVSILLGLAAALVWRFRDRPLLAGVSLGVSVASKVFLWPLAIWLAVTGRMKAAAWSVVFALGALLGSWAVVGFQGLVDYPDVVQRLGERMDERGYTAYALGLDLGLSSGLARVLWLAVAVAVLVAMVVVARRGDDRRAFVLALTLALAISPVVWLHYFVLLLVVVAVAQPGLGPIWFLGLPLQLVITTGIYNGSTFQTAAMLAVFAITVGLALAPSRSASVTTFSSPVAARP